MKDCIQEPQGLAAVVGKTDEKTLYFYGARSKTFLSGTPYYLARALEAVGTERRAFNVIDVPPPRTREVPWTYLRWCLASASKRISLFHLSQMYYDRGARDLAVPEGVTPYFVIWGQYIPAKIRAYRRARPGSRIVQYTDATLLDLMAAYDYAANVPPRLRERMLRDEKEGYTLPDFFAVFHEEVRERLIRDYDVPAHKIRITGRGVNLDPELFKLSATAKRSAHDHKFHLMVVGRGARRKGVFRLIEAIDALTASEQDSLVLTVAGPEASELPSRPYLRPLGFISEDRRDELASEMAASDLGVLLSEAESLPGSIWEFLALKVPVWLSKLPCIDLILSGYPVIFEDLSQGTPALVTRLRTFLRQPEFLAELLAANAKSTSDLTWERAAQSLADYCLWDRIPPDLE